MEKAKDKSKVGTIVELEGRQALVLCVQSVSVLQQARVRDSVEVTYKDLSTKQVHTKLVSEKFREAQHADLV